jgi:hypothetical protein
MTQGGQLSSAWTGDATDGTTEAPSPNQINNALVLCLPAQAWLELCDYPVAAHNQCVLFCVGHCTLWSQERE